ncbi:MAG: hypothetical protein ACM3L9_09820 [Deltaproteobacteria bacterium]
MAVRTSFFALLSAVALAGCAGTGSAGGAQLIDGAYSLSEEEKALDCKRLTGRIQVRLLSLRGEEYKVQPSEVSQSMRTATSTAMGTDTAKNAAARAASDRPMLEAYNKRLVELGCPSFDISKELAARPSAPTPLPTIPAQKR